MGTHTLRLKEMLAMGGGSYEFINGECVVHGANILGLDAYPIHRAEYREHLNGVIFNQYMNEEIGHESDSMFRAAMRRVMNLNMPTFIKLYKTVELDYPMLTTMDITTMSHGENSQTAKSTGTSEQGSTSKSGTRAISSEFPQTMLADDSDYATAGADTNATTEGAGTSSETGESENLSVGDNTSNTSGYQGHAPALIEAYRASIINVDLMVVDSLSELFMLTWGTPERATNRGTFNAYYS